MSGARTVRRLGRFVVEGVAAAGGSGRVLRARHPRLGGPVALKVLASALARRPEAARDFLGEARLLARLARLAHPGIVRGLGAFAARGTHVIAMSWVEGATLRAHLDVGASLGAARVARVADEALATLAALHAEGLVHRDVTPSNLMLDPAGRLVLIDLGLACPRDAAAPARRFVGSPGYCSPEQILGRPVDGRSDVYALACTLYELVFGVPCVDGSSVDAAVDGHLRGVPSFDRVPRVAMGEPFLCWLRRCLSRTRAGRPDAVAARAELRRLVMPARPGNVVGTAPRVSHHGNQVQ